MRGYERRKNDGKRRVEKKSSKDESVWMRKESKQNIKITAIISTLNSPGR